MHTKQAHKRTQKRGRLHTSCAQLGAWLRMPTASTPPTAPLSVPGAAQAHLSRRSPMRSCRISYSFSGEMMSSRAKSICAQDAPDVQDVQTRRCRGGRGAPAGGHVPTQSACLVSAAPTGPATAEHAAGLQARTRAHTQACKQAQAHACMQTCAHAHVQAYVHARTFASCAGSCRRARRRYTRCCVARRSSAMGNSCLTAAWG